jgi:hypothetical protein
MKIVIDIPEKAYEAYKEWDKNKVATVEQSIIANGTPLPKGHGRLKDVDNIKTAFPSGEYVRTESVRATIDHEDTIIEADKEAENEKV